MSADMTIVAAAAGGAVLFALVHIFLLRYTPPEAVLKRIIMIFAATGLATIVMNAALLGNRGIAAWLMGTGVSFLLYGLMSFLYVLCIFGPFESSVRLRLVHELYSFPEKRASLAQILERYNAGQIIQRRLARLVCNRDVIFDGTHYRPGKRSGYFLLMDRVLKILEKLTSGKTG